MAAPVIVNIYPNQGSDKGGDTVSIIGTDLLSPTSVKINDIDCTNIVSTATLITCKTPALTASAIPYHLDVTTAGGTDDLPAAFRSNTTSLVRLGSPEYDIIKLIDQVQVLSGQLDPELVPRRSIGEHINLATHEVVSLLNNLCAPFYGCNLKVTNGNLDNHPNALTVPDTNYGVLKAVTVYGTGISALSYVADLTLNPHIDKVTAVVNSLTGTTKQARDISQFNGIAFGKNQQWQKSSVWLHYGNYVYLWYGSGMTTPDFYFNVYRQAVPLDETETVTGVAIDVPDKYVSLVIAKATLYAMKQSKMGNWQEVAGEVNQGIAQVQAEFEKTMALSAQRPALEAIERTAY